MHGTKSIRWPSFVTAGGPEFNLGTTPNPSLSSPTFLRNERARSLVSFSIAVRRPKAGTTRLRTISVRHLRALDSNTLSSMHTPPKGIRRAIPLFAGLSLTARWGRAAASGSSSHAPNTGESGANLLKTDFRFDFPLHGHRNNSRKAHPFVGIGTTIPYIAGMATAGRLLECDACAAFRRVEAELSCEELPGEWRCVDVPGWVGHFHACTDLCARRLNSLAKPRKGE